jgi:hypothetical protein
MRAVQAATAVATVALACVAAAPNGPIFFPTHAYGLGERQAYVIARDTRLVLRFARADGTIGSKTIAGADERSVAFTVEGFSDNGQPVLGVATEGLADSRVSSEQPLETSSPVIEADGSVRNESFRALAPVALVLNGLEAQAMDIGSTWHGHGDLELPFARAGVRLDGKVNFKSGEAQETLLQALLQGSAAISGHPLIAPFGALRLAGGGMMSGSAYFSPSRRLLLGMDLTVTGNGNATDSRGRRGTYALVAHWSIKLARFASGAVPGPGLSPGIGIPATEMGGAAPAATNVYSQGSPADVFHPASITPDVIDTTNASAPPPAAPSPDESLPPIPIEMPSDQPVASPPPGPTPTSS